MTTPRFLHSLGRRAAATAWIAAALVLAAGFAGPATAQPQLPPQLAGALSKSDPKQVLPQWKVEVYVPNYLDNTVTVLRPGEDAASDVTVHPGIRVGDGPSGIAVAPNRKKVYVANYRGNSVSVIDMTSFNVIKEIKEGIGNGPVEVVYVPSRETFFSRDLGIYEQEVVYVANFLDSTVSVIHPETDRVVAVIPVVEKPLAMMHTPACAGLYVLSGKAPVGTRIDTTWALPRADLRVQQFTLEGNQPTRLRLIEENAFFVGAVAFSADRNAYTLIGYPDAINAGERCLSDLGDRQEGPRIENFASPSDYRVIPIAAGVIPPSTVVLVHALIGTAFYSSTLDIRIIGSLLEPTTNPDGRANFRLSREIVPGAIQLPLGENAYATGIGYTSVRTTEGHLADQLLVNLYGTGEMLVVSLGLAADSTPRIESTRRIRVGRGPTNIAMVWRNTDDNSVEHLIEGFLPPISFN